MHQMMKFCTTETHHSVLQAYEDDIGVGSKAPKDLKCIEKLSGLIEVHRQVHTLIVLMSEES
jgi:hypothetical protein